MVESYVSNQVVVFPGPRHARAVKVLKRVAARLGIDLVETRRSEELARVLNDPRYQRVPQSFELHDRPRDRIQRGSADAPLLIEEYEAQTSRDDELKRLVGLNRELRTDAALSMTGLIQGFGPMTVGHGPMTVGHGPMTVGHGPMTVGHGPMTVGHGPMTVGHGPMTVGHGPMTIGHPASPYGDRQPVTWAAPAPHRRGDDEIAGRRPVVMILDTGIGDHPWFGPDKGVKSGLELDEVQVGYTDEETDPERHGKSSLLGGLDSHSGHGTFIAGLIRQTCPDADLHAVRVMRSNGVANEYELLRVLHVLLEKLDRAEIHVDILVMSFGYSHDSPADARYDQDLLPVLKKLGRRGVAVVAAAGNGASTQKVYPAAFAPPREDMEVEDEEAPPPLPRWLADEDEKDEQDKGSPIPVTSVGSLNPNGTVALFSNAGSWVSCWMSGAALVSTMPTKLNGGMTPSVSVKDSLNMTRASIDPDDFSGGFGVWSGTSFAAPLFAGHLAQALLDTKRVGQLTVDEVTAKVRELVDEHSHKELRDNRDEDRKV